MPISASDAAGGLRQQLSLLRRLLAYALRQRPSLAAVAALGVLSAGIELVAMASLIPVSEIATGRSVPQDSFWHDMATSVGMAPGLIAYCAIFLTLVLLRLLSAGAVSALTSLAFRRLIAHFSARAFEAFTRHLSFAQVQKESIGHYITLAGDEANRASQIVAAVTRLIPIAALAVLYAAALFLHSPQLGFAVLAFFALTLISLWGGFRKSLELGRRQQQESRTLNTHFIESLSGLRTVRGYNGEAFVADKYDRMIRGYAWTSFAVDFVNLLGRMVPAALLALVLLTSLLLFVDEQAFYQHIAFVFIAAVMVMRLLPVVGQGLDALLRLTADLKAASNVSEVLDVVRSAGTHASASLPALAKAIQRIEFDNVSFRYGDAAPEVVRNFSACFVAGSSYAIAGPSGSGKSTLVDLLLGYFAPASGRILVNGEDMIGLATESLRRRIALVEQSTRVFNVSIAQNVLLGRSLSHSDAQRALVDAGMEDVVARLDEGADTVLAYQGSNLSGGQRQRLGIARGLAGNPDVLILDESTAGLDVDTRDRVIVRLKQLYRDRILILLTHDEGLLSQVDSVVRLQPTTGSQGPLAQVDASRASPRFMGEK